MPSEAAKLHTPRADVATIHTDPNTWWVEVSAESTIVELALLLRGLPCPVRTEHMGEGVLRLHPTAHGYPAPLAADLAAILSAPLEEPLPMLLARQAT